MILRDLLPCSLLEEWQNSINNDEFVQQLLTSYELLVDSAEQPRERPKDYQEQKKLFSGKKQRHTFKNQFVSLNRYNAFTLSFASLILPSPVNQQIPKKW